jgi:hypothetical protein
MSGMFQAQREVVLNLDVKIQTIKDLVLDVQEQRTPSTPEEPNRHVESSASALSTVSTLLLDGRAEDPMITYDGDGLIVDSLSQRDSDDIEVTGGTHANTLLTHDTRPSSMYCLDGLYGVTGKNTVDELGRGEKDEALQWNDFDYTATMADIRKRCSVFRVQLAQIRAQHQPSTQAAETSSCDGSEASSHDGSEARRISADSSDTLSTIQYVPNLKKKLCVVGDGAAGKTWLIK